MSRSIVALLIITFALVVPALAVRSAAVMPSNTAATDWSARLEALDPADPLAYFLLGEEVADVAENQSEVELARRLFALAAILSPERLGRSACIALADITDDEQQRRRFVALASLLGSGNAAHVDALAIDGLGWLDPQESSIMALGDALSFYRRGLGTRAASRLSRADAVSLLRAVEQSLPSGTARQLLDPSPAARARPRLSPIQIIHMLQVEAALLGGRDRTWSSDLVLTRSQPLIDLDPTRLDEALGVDASRPQFRNGRWVQ